MMQRLHQFLKKEVQLLDLYRALVAPGAGGGELLLELRRILGAEEGESILDKAQEVVREHHMFQRAVRGFAELRQERLNNARHLAKVIRSQRKEIANLHKFRSEWEAIDRRSERSRIVALIRRFAGEHEAEASRNGVAAMEVASGEVELLLELAKLVEDSGPTARLY